MRLNSIKRFYVPAALAAQLVLPAAAMAAAASGDSTSAGLDEIVVTATRRVERLQDVPVSVLAFGQEKIDAQGLKDIDDLVRAAPGVVFLRNGMSSSGNYNDESSDINIRGIDSTAGTSTTGIYIDDTPIQTRKIGFGSINAFPALFDLDRVEMLRGPQGTLFGAGAEGGVVRFLAPEPDVSKPSGYSRGDMSTTDGGSPSYEVGAAIGTPMIEDVLGVRASFSYRKDGGWVDRSSYSLSPNSSVLLPTPVFTNTYWPNANYSSTMTGRLAFKWKVNDALEVMPSVYYQRLQINDTSAYWMSLSNSTDNVFRNGNAGTNPSDDTFILSAIRLKWDMGFAQLFSNTAYYYRNQSGTSDYTQYLRATWTLFGELPNTFPQPGDNGYAKFHDAQRNFYQEIRLSSTDTSSWFLWTGGVFYSHLSESVPEQIIDPTLNQEVINYTGGAASVCYPGQECPGGLIYNGPTDQVIDKQIAIFGDLTFKFLDTLKFTAGVRLSKVDYTGYLWETGPFLGATVSGSPSGNENSVTPKGVLTWQPDRDNMMYVSAAKGFRPGGPNFPVAAFCSPDLQALGLSQTPGQYASDSLWSYELGSKNEFFDHKLQINGSLFYVDWSNIQQNVYLPSCGEQFAANLGKAKSEGGDLELIYRPIPTLTLDMTAAYTKASLTKTSCAGSYSYDVAIASCVSGNLTARPIASDGNALLGAPWTFSGSAEYHFGEWGGRLPYVRADYQHSNAQHALLPGQDSNNGLYDTTLPGLPVINNLSLRAGMRFNGLDVSAYANNVTNSNPLIFEARDIATFPQSVDNLYFGRGTRPRTIGVTATYRY